MAHLLPPLKTYIEDANGIPLAGGKVYSYAAGTSTPLVTYADASESTPNANPVILDANGQASIWIGSSAYKFTVTDENDVPLFTVDQVTHLGNGSVTTNTIADGAVTTAKIADGAVTADKIFAKDIRRQNLTIPSITATTPTVLAGTLTIDSSGKPIRVGLRGVDNAGTPARLKISGTGSEAKVSIDIYRGVTKILSHGFSVGRNTGSAELDSFTTPGTHTYTVQSSGLIIIEGAGGGGGGAGGGGSGGGGGAGGSSYHPPITIPVTAGEVLTVVVGAKGSGSLGAGGGASSSAATAGGDTYITSDLRGEIFRVKGAGGGGGVADGITSGSTGGAGGAAGSFGAAGGSGGNDAQTGGGTGQAGGTGGQTTFNPIYGPASGGPSTGANSAYGGSGGGGGSNPFGIGGTGGTAGNPATVGSNGNGYGTGGGGGGGGHNGVAGANGGNGVDGCLFLYDSGISSGLQTLSASIPPSSISTLDNDAAEGTHNYTVQVYVNAATTTFSAEGTISLEAYEEI